MAVDKLVDSTQLDGYFTNIASAIRSKAGVSSTYTPAEMPQAIQDIPSGGGSSYTLIAENEYTVSTTSTSISTVATIVLDKEYYSKDYIIYVKIRDKAGKRTGYFLGSDNFFYGYQAANNATTGTYGGGLKAIIKYKAGEFVQSYSSGTNGYGVYVTDIGLTSNSTGVTAINVTISSRYNSTSSLTIDGTYLVQVYKLEFPDNISPYQ